MSPQEFAALPDVTPSIGHRVEHNAQGVRVVVPVLQGFTGALFIGPDDGEVIDAAGDRWIVGWIAGRRVRRRVPD